MFMNLELASMYSKCKFVSAKIQADKAFLGFTDKL